MAARQRMSDHWLERAIHRDREAPVRQVPLHVAPRRLLPAEHDALINCQELLRKRHGGRAGELEKITTRSPLIPAGFQAAIASQELVQWRDPSMLPSHPINRALRVLARLLATGSGFDLVTLGANAVEPARPAAASAGESLAITADMNFAECRLPLGWWIRTIQSLSQPWGLEGCPYWDADPTFAAPRTLVPPRGHTVHNFFYTQFHERRGFPLQIALDEHTIRLRVGPLENDPIVRDQVAALLRGIAVHIRRQPWARRDLGTAKIIAAVRSHYGTTATIASNTLFLSRDGVRCAVPIEAVPQLLDTAPPERPATGNAEVQQCGDGTRLREGPVGQVLTQMQRGLDPSDLPASLALRLAAAMGSTDVTLIPLGSEGGPRGMSQWRIELGSHAYFVRKLRGGYLHCASPTVTLRPEAWHADPLELLFTADGALVYAGLPPSTLRIETLWSRPAPLASLLDRFAAVDPVIATLQQALLEFGTPNINLLAHSA